MIPAIALISGAVLLTGCAPGSSQEAPAPSTETAPSEQAEQAEGGSGGEACEVLTSDTLTAATVFAPIIPGQTDLQGIQNRIQLVDSVAQPPADLSAEWQEWRGFLDFAEENFESDPNAVILQYQEVDESADALSHFYTSTCL